MNTLQYLATMFVLGVIGPCEYLARVSIALHEPDAHPDDIKGTRDLLTQVAADMRRDGIVIYRLGATETFALDGETPPDATVTIPTVDTLLAHGDYHRKRAGSAYN